MEKKKNLYCLYWISQHLPPTDNRSFFFLPVMARYLKMLFYIFNLTPLPSSSRWLRVCTKTDHESKNQIDIWKKKRESTGEEKGSNCEMRVGELIRQIYFELTPSRKKSYPRCVSSPPYKDDSTLCTAWVASTRRTTYSTRPEKSLEIIMLIIIQKKKINTQSG